MEAGHADAGHRLPEVSQNLHFTFDMCFIQEDAEVLLKGKKQETEVDETGREI